MFSLCYSLTSFPDISIWDTRNLIVIKQIFHGCISLVEIPDISKWKMPLAIYKKVNKIDKITNMNFLFNECFNCRNIPDFL